VFYKNYCFSKFESSCSSFLIILYNNILVHPFLNGLFYYFLFRGLSLRFLPEFFFPGGAFPKTFLHSSLNLQDLHFQLTGSMNHSFFRRSFKRYAKVSSASLVLIGSTQVFISPVSLIKIWTLFLIS